MYFNLSEHSILFEIEHENSFQLDDFFCNSTLDLDIFYSRLGLYIQEGPLGHSTRCLAET